MWGTKYAFITKINKINEAKNEIKINKIRNVLRRIA
jgi:hypothetical protein